MSRPVILCVDDEKSILTGLKQELEFQLGERYEVELAESGEEALDVAHELLADGVVIPVVLSDQLMPGMKGDEFIVRFKQLSPDTKTILLTGQASADSVGHALNNGGLYRYISKPWEPQDLKMTVQRALEAFYHQAEFAARRVQLARLTDNLRALSAVALTNHLGQTFLSQVLDDTAADRGILFTADAFGELSPTLYLQREGAFVRPVDEPLDYPPDVVNLAFLNAEPAYEPQLDWNKAGYAAVLQKSDTRFAGVYLEYDQANALDSSTQDFLKLMLAGAATFFESARLYSDLEEKVRMRTHEIEEQNTELTASIRYARRIQKAMFPLPEQLKQLFPNSFMLFLPREHVSGDFYWLHSEGGIHYIALGDASGQAIPAAFLTMLVTSQLNLLVGNKGLTDPADILRKLHASIQHSLHHGGLPDGMDTLGLELAKSGVDFALCKVDTSKNVLHFAGAGRPLLHLRGGKPTVLAGQKLSLGHLKPATSPDKIKTTKLTLEQGDRFFLYSDGLMKQPGGPDGEPFGEDRFQALLLELQGQPMSRQYEQIASKGRAWMVGQAQLDDILMVGVGV